MQEVSQQKSARDKFHEQKSAQNKFQEQNEFPEEKNRYATNFMNK